MCTAAVRKNWLQRWFVLDFDSGDLAYFENKQVPNLIMVEHFNISWADFVEVVITVHCVSDLCRLSVTRRHQRG